jgi:hypothetical protein
MSHERVSERDLVPAAGLEDGVLDTPVGEPPTQPAQALVIVFERGLGDAWGVKVAGQSDVEASLGDVDARAKS